MTSNSEASGPKRLGKVEGFNDRRNEIIYHPSEVLPITGCVIFFGGDMQDYKENMLAHRDNKRHAKWDLESTTTILHSQFPDQAIIVVKPAKMALLTFSCYENFVDVNNFGAPIYANDTSSLSHLKSLLLGIESTLSSEVSDTTDIDSNLLKTSSIHGVPLTLIGFSKGCVVLNQFLYSFHSLQKGTGQELVMFVGNISNMYWLDSGHSGESNTWITDQAVLESLAKLKINVHIHVTPYQVCCDTRPRIGREEKKFREGLCRLGVNVKRKLHFEFKPRGLERHFEVLEVFTQYVDN